MVPQSLSTVLFAVASVAPEKIPEKLRFVLRVSLAIGIPTGLAVGLGGRYILSRFGSSYAELAAGPLWLLVAAYVPGLFSQTYIAVARAHGRFNQAAIFLTAFAVLRMIALLAGGKIDGLYGVATGTLAVQLVQSLITVPSVLRTAFGTVTARSAVDSVAADEERLWIREPAEVLRRRQEAGLAALLALATRVAPSSPWPAANALFDDPAVQRASVPPQTRVQRAPALSQTRAQRVLSPSQPRVTHRRHRRHAGVVAATRASPVLADTSWWPDSDEATFRYRQEMGMATLIAIATQPARLLPT
jgi:hypothetical protein